MPLHTHTVTDPDSGETVVLSPETGRGHSHVAEIGGERVRTSVQSGSTDHAHHVVTDDGGVVQTSPAEPVVPTLAKSFPDVLSWEAVREGRMPPHGESGLPESLEGDIPGRFRYWKAETPEAAAAIRLALVASGLVSPELVRQVTVKRDGEVVGTELRRVVIKETRELVIPETESGDPVVPPVRKGIEVAADAAGLDADAVQFTASVVEMFGLDEVVRKADERARDWVIEVAPGSLAAERLGKRYDRSTAFRLHESDAAVYLASGIPDEGAVRWEHEPPDDVVKGLVTRQTMSVAEMAALADDLAVPEHVMDVANALVAIVGKRAWTTAEKRVATRAVTLIQRELGKGADASGDVLRALGVDVHHACHGLRERIGEIRLHKSVNPDDGERFVYGVVLEPDRPDLQGDVMSAEDIRKAAHGFMEYSGQLGLQHAEIITGKVVILESFLAPCDFEVEGDVIRKGTWVLAERVRDDELWAGIKSGAITGFSIGGTGRRIPIAADERAMYEGAE